MKASKTYSSGFAECQTEDFSPTRQGLTSSNKKSPNPTSEATTQPQSKKPSHTEQQIYSHDLITSIMNKRLNNTVKHKIGSFDPDVQLYAKPLTQYDNGLLEFSDQRQMYQSQYTKKINQINTKLNHGKTLTQRIKHRKDYSSLFFRQIINKNKRPASARQSQVHDQVNKKISVSGLVSYNFNSINARKTLGYDFQPDSQKLSQIMSKLQSRNKCCSTRQQSIIEKKHKKRAIKNNEIKQAIFSDFQTKTSNFLNNLHEQIQDQNIVYGMKWSKLLCIKQMMANENIGYEEAQAIVQEIQSKRKETKKDKQPVKKLQRNDENELNMRKQVVQKNRIMVKQLYFLD